MLSHVFDKSLSNRIVPIKAGTQMDSQMDLLCLANGLAISVSPHVCFILVLIPISMFLTKIMHL